MTKMIVLEIVMARRKLQSTLLKLSPANDTKIRTGRENFPTKIFSPLACCGLRMLKNPASQPRSVAKLEAGQEDGRMGTGVPEYWRSSKFLVLSLLRKYSFTLVLLRTYLRRWGKSAVVPEDIFSSASISVSLKVGSDCAD
jgi:hypothetical protein